MPSPSELARAQYAQREALVAATAVAAAHRWAKVNPADIVSSWARESAALSVAVSGAQLAAAQTADPYVQATLAAEGIAPAAQLALSAGTFAGVAADGRDLMTLLYEPAVTSLVAIRDGADVTRALVMGATQLDTIVRTEVADAGRVATGVAVTAEPQLDGYMRLTVGPTCSRCIILAGRIYQWSEGFLRHPRCDCIMVPAVAGRAAGFAQSPKSVYESMTPEERSKAGWSRAEQQAIADGADIAAVTNIHRGGIYTAGGRKYTREAAGRRPRITPEQIYRDAAGDRAEAIRLLLLHKYIR